jgi:hypothetical protein
MLGDVLSDGIHMGTTSVLFHACLPERVSKGHQSFLPCEEGAFSAVNSLSRARSCSCSSTKTVEALRHSTSKSRHHDQEASLGKHWHRMKTHLACDDARLEEALIPTQRGGDG